MLICQYYILYPLKSKSSEQQEKCLGEDSVRDQSDSSDLEIEEFSQTEFQPPSQELAEEIVSEENQMQAE